jgi:hypothetical protein
MVGERRDKERAEDIEAGDYSEEEDHLNDADINEI